MAINKVVYGNDILVDLTGDTVGESVLLFGYTAHRADGTIITGTLFKGYPASVTVVRVQNGTTGNRKDKNKIVYSGQVLIDLTDDTMTQDVLLWGYKGHRNDGTVIHGSFLSNYPEEIVFEDDILDSSKAVLMDSSKNPVRSRIVYKRTGMTNTLVVYTKQ